MATPDKCPVCGDGYGLVEERYEGHDGKGYEPVWCATCHAWHENVYDGGLFLGTEAYLDGNYGGMME